MAHFAELNSDNIVQRIIVVANPVLDDNGVENEQLGIDFCKSLYGQDTVWKQCSYNGNIRYRYPAIGMFYDSIKDGFYTPQPYDNWIWSDTQNCYVPPIPYPGDADTRYMWDQVNTQWVELSE